MTTENMNKGVQILLERIKSNPEEFTPDIAGRYPDKWRIVLQEVQARVNGEKQFLDFLSNAEIAELWRAMQNVRSEQFTKKVMNTLLRDGVELSPSYYLEPSESLKNKTQEIVEKNLDLAWKEAYAKHTIDTFKYLTKGKQIFKGKE